MKVDRALPRVIDDAKHLLILLTPSRRKWVEVGVGLVDIKEA